MTNQSLRNARVAKKDEFYTQYEDIEKELVHYTEQLKGKTVYCNCDNPSESNFVSYFTNNFKSLGLNKLIATHYVDSQTAKPHKLVLTQADNADGFISTLTPLTGDGDFRSDECVALLRASDIVVTNPPFSIWREFAELITANNKLFITLGTIQATNYKVILDGIITGTIQTGYTNYNKTLKFIVPEHYDGKITADGVKTAEVPVCWWTNLPVTNRKPIRLHKHYSPDTYPKYEAKNTKGKPVDTVVYDAINVDRVDDIPCDYDGFMGVPITILGKIDYNQFEVIDKINNGFIGGRKVFTRLIIKHKKSTSNIKRINKQTGRIRQTTTAYISTGGVCMVDDNGIQQQIEVIHTIPKMTQTERLVAEKRIANDLFSVLSDIYEKLQSDSE